MKTLYAISKTGAIITWTIGQTKYNEIEYIWGQMDGNMQSMTELVEINQSGRTLQEQVNLRMQSRTNRRYDLGYKDSINEAVSSQGTNACGLLRPMLALKYDAESCKNVRSKIWQYKYNGHRCLVTRQGDKLISYTRNGKPVQTIQHILDNIDIPEGTTLDGELYVPGMNLQGISSLARRVQPDNKKLSYIVYDQISNDHFEDRFNELDTYKLGDGVIIAPTQFDIGISMLDNKFIVDNAINKGYEGFMLRDANDGGYKPGKRVNSLLKVKTRMDHEFFVVDVHESKEGWGIIECANDINFKVTSDWRPSFRTPAPGDHDAKRDVLVNKHLYIGNRVRVEYPELTVYGTPFHPVAMEWVDEILL